ncbi:cbb3-type cytochrome oxidase subunit 3 [Sphingomonas sp.]|uniref:cbb3-type cytochrome oxidase subunit 3 n=1 Tax=Sphingomonas sp. TaxID=28214 RepID=UPI002DD67F95|nr:cbb3-type cytochrome c oxidase subunit 3 [Sphingomonas sp.]
MSYNELRHIADSYGLIFLGVVFLILIGWTFRRRASEQHARAANMIFENEDERDG